MVLPRFVTQALKNEPLTVYGTGHQTRTFTYVKDVVNALIQLMETEAAFGEVFNVGGTEEVSIKSLAEKIIKATESSSTIQIDSLMSKLLKKILKIFSEGFLVLKKSTN